MTLMFLGVKQWLDLPSGNSLQSNSVWRWGFTGHSTYLEEPEELSAVV